MEVTDGVKDTQEETKGVDETTKNEKKEEYVSFDEILTDPDYKSAYDKKVNDLLLKKQAEWSKNAEESKNKDLDLKTKEIVEKAQIEAMDLRIENALLLKGISPSKSGRAKRLIDKTVLLNDTGTVDQDKLNIEIENLLKDFPELNTKNEKNAGFVIGADGKQEKKEDEMSKIRKIMGLK